MRLKAKFINNLAFHFEFKCIIFSFIKISVEVPKKVPNIQKRLYYRGLKPCNTAFSINKWCR